MDKILREKYAAFAVKTAVNLQKGQTLVVRCGVEGAEFARLCAKAGYEAGAREVVVHYDDEKLARLRMEQTDVAVLEDVKPWKLASVMEYVDSPGSMAILRVVADDPEIYKGLDTAKVERASRAASKASRPFQELTMAGKVQWSIVAIPGAGWASRVYPGLPLEEAVEKLWQAIFTACRVGGGDPEGAWQRHVAEMKAHREWIQALGLASLRLASANGTDLTVKLAEDAVWGGAEEFSTGGVPFLPNVPTEEVFTAPHRLGVDGVVKSSLPYVYNGNLIEGITVRFAKGKAVEYSAEKGGDLLEQMLSADEGAKHLGEIALVPASSPIRQSGTLFYNTLFDENAACHMAFGAGYPGTIKGGEELGRDALLAKGVNDSLVHEDIMIGTADLTVTGLTRAGESVAVFENGEWAGGAIGAKSPAGG